MAGRVRIVNVLPAITVEDDEDVVKCSICSKGFVSELALLNHVRMEHFSAYSTGDPANWTTPVIKAEPIEVEEIITKEQIEVKKEAKRMLSEQRTQELISSMEPTNLMTLVSEDVSYIIMEDTSDKNTFKVKKTKKVEKLDRKRKEASPPLNDIVIKKEFIDEDNSGDEIRTKLGRPAQAKKTNAVSSLMGPFECMEPTDNTADGICHQIFSSCCEYSAHYRDEHTRRRKCLHCQVCEKPLLQGLDPADIERIFNCLVCGIGFLSNKELKDHTNKEHIKLKPFKCSVCPKRFTQQGGLQQHMRMHTGVRPFPCTYCSKAFTQKSGLEQHLRIHTKEKPYRCVVCHKSFIQPTHLKQHMRTHTNLAPFQCGICQKKFKQGSQLTCHLRVHGVTNMTDEQKEKYVKLLAAAGDASEMVEIEVDQSEADLIEQVEAERSITIQEDNEIEYEEAQAVILEPIEGEESIQIEQVNDECYVIDEDGTQTWSVELVDS